MTNTLAHRGPDSIGLWLSPHAALGHRRFALGDPEDGNQPMVRKRGDTSYVLVYNGRLYNAKELRRDLTSRGHRFDGESDAEVVLAAYLEWGAACPQLLDGMFAFGVWNDQDQQLFLARDRLGVKPLFYTVRGDLFLFASEIKALLAHPRIEAEVDEEGLAEVFGLGPGHTPGKAVFRGIYEVKAGQTLIHDRRSTRHNTYWRFISHPHTDDLVTTAERVRELFLSSVERQLRAPTPPSTLLSGGLDSSAISTIAANMYRRERLPALHTWSVDFVDNDKHFQQHSYQPNSDAPYIPKMVEAIGSQHHDIVIDTMEQVEALASAMRARDLPGMADIDSSLLLFCQEIRKGGPVTLSGEAADEVFGGYPWFYMEASIQANTFPWALRPDLRHTILAPEWAERLRVKEYIAQHYADALAEVPRLADESPTEARMREISYLTLTRFGPILLDRKDRMSMACGLEARIPFCDHKLVEYVWNIPWSMKTCDGASKGILRRALAGLLPEEIRMRRKSPYPKTHNPNYLHAVRSAVLQILDDPNSRLQSFLDHDFLRSIAASPEASSNTPWFSQLMSGPQLFAYLLQTEMWLNHYNVRVR